MSSKPGHGVRAAAWQRVGVEAHRQNATRDTILVALDRLKMPEDRRPQFVRDHKAGQVQQAKFRHRITPEAFAPPVFDSVNQSTEDWVKAADAAWAKHRDQFVQRRKYWISVGVDSEIPAAKRVRGSGKSSSATQRYDWAAMRLCGEPWKEIAAIHQTKESTVSKAATAILRMAGWPTKAPSNKPGK